MDVQNSQTTGNEPSKAVVGSGGKPQPKAKLKPLAIIIVIAMIAGGLYVYWQRHQSNVAVNAVCTSSKPIMSEASQAISSGKPDKLVVISDKVQKLKNYEKDPNCLNIVLTYYISISDSVNAKATLDKLNLVFDVKKGFSGALGPKARSMKDLRDSVAFLEKLSRNLSKNSSKFSQPQ